MKQNTIAQQCPDEGGPAVYRARSLYRLCATADFDSAPCQVIAPLLGQYGQRALPQPAAKVAGFRVFPNPNSGRFALEYELEADGQLLLTDLMGRSLAPIPLPAGERRMEAMPEGIRPGLYLLRIVSARGALLHSEKIIIIN